MRRGGSDEDPELVQGVVWAACGGWGRAGADFVVLFVVVCGGAEGDGRGGGEGDKLAERGRAE